MLIPITKQGSGSAAAHLKGGECLRDLQHLFEQARHRLDFGHRGGNEAVGIRR
jgi:hypothetical protein